MSEINKIPTNRINDNHSRNHKVFCSVSIMQFNNEFCRKNIGRREELKIVTFHLWRSSYFEYESDDDCCVKSK